MNEFVSMVKRDQHIVMVAALWSVLFLLIAAIAQAGYWLFAPISPPFVLTVNYATDPAGNRKEEFKRGEPLHYYREGTLLSIVPRTAYQSIVYLPTGEAFMRFPPMSPRVNSMGPFKMRYYVTVLPQYFPLGEYEIQTIMLFEPNPLRTPVAFNSAPIRFKVVE